MLSPAAPSTFNANESHTWPTLLTLEQVAAIWQRPVGGIRTSVRRGTFRPMPIEGKPHRWRRVDVLRVIEGLSTVRRSA